MEFKFRNVNEAFEDLVMGMATGEIPTIRTESRVGDVIQISEPVLIEYECPTERVLFNPYRDANPFFHLFEALWMLAGRNDVAPLRAFSSKIGDVASDDGTTFNGAYGYRWRAARGTDQLGVLVKHLTDNQKTRRAVLQMWNVQDDLKKLDTTKDVCCNTAVYFSIREEPEEIPTGVDPHTGEVKHGTVFVKYLDMTVTNRSNDLIWGCLGANYVHFSMLQEYMASEIGVAVGKYYQFTNNLHVYTSNNSGWKPKQWLSYYQRRTQHSPPMIAYRSLSQPLSGSEVFQLDKEEKEKTEEEIKHDLQYRWQDLHIVSNYLMDLCAELDTHSKDYDWLLAFAQHFITGNHLPGGFYQRRFLSETVKHMLIAYTFYKAKEFDLALKYSNSIPALDWRLACTEWIQRRKEKAADTNKGETDAV